MWDALLTWLAENWVALLAALGTGGVGGTLASLFGPWNQMLVNQREKKRESQRERILQTRLLVSSCIASERTSKKENFRGEPKDAVDRFLSDPLCHWVRSYMTEDESRQAFRGAENIHFDATNNRVCHPLESVSKALARIERELDLA